ncbi:hypothetical protein MTsPCn9_01350 [Croceitalea sp. MTPC9]|nr:hypothetical protein MTsPCn6_07360 [Croceitalea sp. MTPC6]GMN15199.1 hypothetical protein MTsPCn9_01350 [Croceitalea sp. MTPC9]
MRYSEDIVTVFNLVLVKTGVTILKIIGKKITDTNILG